MKLKWIYIAIGVWIGVFALANAPSPSSVFGKPPLPVPTPTPALTGFGALIVNVTAAEKAAWGAGRVEFQVIETIPSGLGPEFNGQSCQQCHGQPQVNGKDTVGGAAANTETHFVSPTFGADLFHLSSISPAAQDAIPTDSTAITVRKSNTTAGLGLIEEIRDSDIIANANQNGKDGVFGRPAMLSDATTLATGSNRVGRFGWKAQLASTTAFSADALLNELGITTRIPGRTTDISPHVTNGFAILTAAEPTGITPTTLQDTPLDPTMPESPTNTDRVERLHNFLRFNAPPPTVPLSDSALRGQVKFAQIGCAGCHTPTMTTGAAGGSVALAFQPVHLYSDLLLHHMGTLGDQIPQGNAGPDEMRTAPLWGLRGRSPFLHNGSAATIQAAIEAHDAPGAESAKIAQRFEHLPVADQADILDFLSSI
jgi:CxxC motif-containing protein (DUF1111 family)